MQRPTGYNEAKVQGEFEKVELGGHYMIIKQVSEKKNKNGGDMIVVLFDFDTNDKQGGYFMASFKKDDRQDKKWSNQATQYINVNGNDGKCSSAFKTFCTCVEHSNAGFKVFDDNGNFNFNGIKGKKIGGVFGEQMDFYNGESKKKVVLRWFVSIDKVADAKIPDMNETKAYKDWKSNGGVQTPAPGTQGFDDWMKVTDAEMEELPFN